MTIDLLTRLNAEWNLIRRRPAVVRRAQGWAITVQFDSLDELVCAAGYRPAPGWPGWHPSMTSVGIQSATAATADACLAQLVAVAHTDDIAARVVLQRVLPALVSKARRWRDRVEPGQHAVEEIVASSWHVIRTFPLERTSVQPAARLVADSEYHAFIRHRRRLGEHIPTEHQHLDRAASTARSPLDELTELVGSARLSPADRALLHALLQGGGLHDVADRLQVSIRTVTNRRMQLVERLRQAA